MATVMARSLSYGNCGCRLWVESLVPVATAAAAGAAGVALVGLTLVSVTIKSCCSLSYNYSEENKKKDWADRNN